ncbi:hypothetical protein [Nocardioides zeae]
MTAALAVADPEQVVVDDRPVAWDCAGQAPRVCLPRESPRQLAWLAARMDEMAEPLAAVGATVPATYRLEVPGSPSTRTRAASRLSTPAGSPRPRADRRTSRPT